MTDMLHVFKSLSDRTRLRIVRLLLERDLCVCELMFILGMAQSRVSHQLRILRDAGLVEDIRDGQWIIYRVPSLVRETIKPLLDLFPRKTDKLTEEEAADQDKLKACLKSDIRKKKLAGCPNRPRNASNPRTGG